MFNLPGLPLTPTLGPRTMYTPRAECRLFHASLCWMCFEAAGTLLPPPRCTSLPALAPRMFEGYDPKVRVLVVDVPWLIDGTLAVYVFFVVSGFSLSTGWVAKRDPRLIARMALSRYLRLALPIFANSVIAAILIKSKGFCNIEAGESTSARALAAARPMQPHQPPGCRTWGVDAPTRSNLHRLQVPRCTAAGCLSSTGQTLHSSRCSASRLERFSGPIRGPRCPTTPTSGPCR